MRPFFVATLLVLSFWFSLGFGKTGPQLDPWGRLCGAGFDQSEEETGPQLDPWG